MRSNERKECRWIDWIIPLGLFGFSSKNTLLVLSSRQWVTARADYLSKVLRVILNLWTHFFHHSKTEPKRRFLERVEGGVYDNKSLGCIPCQYSLQFCFNQGKLERYIFWRSLVTKSRTQKAVLPKLLRGRIKLKHMRRTGINQQCCVYCWTIKQCSLRPFFGFES